MRFVSLVLLTACGASPATTYAVRPPAPCAEKRTVRVVDASGAPIAGAVVRSEAVYRQCGPSGIPEGCAQSDVDSPTAETDAAGAATVCAADRLDRRIYARELVVAYRDWPRARVDAETAVITVGPARTVIVEVPLDGCVGPEHLHVVAGDAKVTPLGPGRVELSGLGPWRYWVHTRDDRSGNGATEKDACRTHGRVLDAGRSSLALDRSDTTVERPDFAGGRAQLSAMRSDAVLASATLDDAGRAVLTLPPETPLGGGTFCMRLTSPDGARCAMAFASAGGTTSTVNAQMIAADCGPCSP